MEIENPRNLLKSNICLVEENTCKDRETWKFFKPYVTGALPLRGSIPDMTADSERYIQLQNAYIEQANRDVAAITDKVNMLTNSLVKVWGF